MSDLLQMVTSRLDGQALGQLAGMLGSDKAGTRNAIESALPMLVAGLNRNAQTSDGAAALQQAVAKDHDGSILDGLSGFLGNGPSQRDDRMVDHIFGNRRQAIEQNIGQSSGLSQAASGKLMATLAPLVMGAIGKQKSGGGLDMGSLIGMLGSANKTARKQPGGGVLAGLIDGDGDGDVDISDLTKLGGGLLGKFFK